MRLLSATNKDLLALQAGGGFREDLYWRIKGAEIRLPPLRERPSDIPLLAKHFLNQSAHLCADGRVLRAWHKVKVPGHAAEVLKAARELATA